MKRYQRLKVPFGGEALPGEATIAFEANHTPHVAPAPSITVEAGRRGTWVLTFRPGRDLPAGAQVGFTKVENEFRFDWRHQDYWPGSMGYVTVEDAAGRPLPFECDTALKAATPAIVSLPEGLAAGAPIVVRIGDQRQGGAGVTTWPTSYERARFVVGVRLPGEEAFRPVPEATLAVRVVARPPARQYYHFAPATARPGEEVTVAALPVDVNGNSIAGGAHVTIQAPDGEAVPTTPAREHALHARVTMPAQEGIVRLTLRDPDLGLEAVSNPCRVASDGLRVYWGEFHSHGFDAEEVNVLNENTHPARMFAYGRDVTRLDFMAPGSHIFRQAPRAVEEWWELYREAARQSDAPGRYVPFLGCEWRDREDAGGDRNLVWRDLDAPRPDPTWRIGEVYEALAAQGAMVIPHVGGSIAHPCCHDGRLERLCEMTSGHGNFEWFAQSYLQKGYRVGLIGGSDGHKGTPGHPRTVGVEGGRFYNMLRRRDTGWLGGPLLAVYAPSLDREALWEAFQRRQTYASTGARALVEFRLNGRMMGQELADPVTGNVTIEARVVGTTDIERVDVIRGVHRLAHWEPGAAEFAATLVDRPPTGDTYYYLRVEQADGELLWSSPIWVTSMAGGSVDGLPEWNAPEEVDLAALARTPAATEAAQHLPALERYLETEEQRAAFEDLTPVKVVHAPLGDYAVFFCRVRGKPIRIHYFYGFELPRLRLEAGWVQYGREIIKDQPWAAPLIDVQDKM